MYASSRSFEANRAARGADAMRRQRKQDAPVVVGLAWYRAEDWSTLKAMVADGDQFHHDSYASWLAQGEKVERRLRKQGHVVKRIYIEPGVFRAWCLLKGLPMDVNARTQYASERVRLEAAPDVAARDDQR
jgi:hypothetical protein